MNIKGYNICTINYWYSNTTSLSLFHHLIQTVGDADEVAFKIFIRSTGPVFIEDPVREQDFVVFIDFGSAVLAAGDDVPAFSVVVGEVLTDAVFKFLTDDPAPAVASVFLINILIHILFQSNINKTFWRHINSKIRI